MPSTNIHMVRAEKKPTVSPIWRGIGCILMAALPLVSFGLTVLFTPTIAVAVRNYLPSQFFANADFPAWTYQTPFLADIVTFFHGINYLWLGLLVFIVILILIMSVASLVYVIVMQVIGPSRYGELDAPPSRHKAKAYKR